MRVPSRMFLLLSGNRPSGSQIQDLATASRPHLRGSICGLGKSSGAHGALQLPGDAAQSRSAAVRRPALIPAFREHFMMRVLLCHTSLQNNHLDLICCSALLTCHADLLNPPPVWIVSLRPKISSPLSGPTVSRSASVPADMTGDIEHKPSSVPKKHKAWAHLLSDESALQTSRRLWRPTRPRILTGACQSECLLHGIAP